MHAVAHDFVPLDSVESQWRLEELDKLLFDHYFIQENISTKVKNDQKLTPVTIASLIAESAVKKYKEKCMRQLEMYNKLSFDERVKKIVCRNEVGMTRCSKADEEKL